MEPQEQINYYDNRKSNKKRNCFCVITIILLAAFTFVIGLIIGAAISGAILGTLAAVIVLAVVLGLLLVLSIILMICKKQRCC